MNPTMSAVLLEGFRNPTVSAVFVWPIEIKAFSTDIVRCLGNRFEVGAHVPEPVDTHLVFIESVVALSVRTDDLTHSLSSTVTPHNVATRQFVG
jgi:hypothetical protein